MVMSSAEKSARYRARDVDAYRKKKRELSRTPKHKEVRRLYMISWREKNREKFNKMCSESHGRNRHKHCDYLKNYHLNRAYGISLEQYKAMLLSQNNLCLICEQENQYSKSFHVDHNHENGKVRGLLCNGCNTRLGWYEKWSQKIESYLENSM